MPITALQKNIIDLRCPGYEAAENCP